MTVGCQQKDIFKIRDGIPGHGPQKAMFRFYSPHGEHVKLECGCHLPVSWLKLVEQEVVLRDLSPPKPKGQR